jgi:O-antigen ligase
MDNKSQHASEPSIVALLGGIINDAKSLLALGMALGKLEVQDQLRKGKNAAITLGIAIGIVAVGGLLLMLMLVQVLAAFTEIPLWRCFGIVGTALVAIGGVLLAIGKTKAEELDVVPQQTVETMKENTQWRAKRTTADKT